MGGDSRYAQHFWRRNRSETTKTYRLKTHSVQQASQLLYELDRAAFSAARIAAVARSDAQEVQAIKNAKARAQRLLEAIGSEAGNR